jgi:hypothetical protein
LAAVIPLLLFASVPAFAQDKTTSAATSKVSVSSEKATRHALVYKIVREWGPYVKEIYKEDIGLWADRMVPTLRQADTSKLRAAAQADTFEAMTNALLGQKSQFAAAAVAGKVAKSLGSTVNDLTYTALPGCILVDTRTVGGAFAAGVVRHYKASGANFSAQGGSNTNCGIPTTPVSLVLSVSSISPTSNGYFRMWPYNTTMPAASNISYRTNENIQNDIILKMSQGLTQDFSVQSSGGSHLVVNVLGYFAAPFATQLDCTIQTSTVDVAAAGFNTLDVNCPVLLGAITRSATGGGCENQFSATTNVSQSFPLNNGWRCAMRNNGASAVTLTAYARCCRVPGRDPGIIFL